MSVSIKKFFRGADASNLGAFPCGGNVTFELCLERSMGVGIPLLRIAPDGEGDRDFEFDFVFTDGVKDTYRLDFNPAELVSTDGLLYYCFVFPHDGKASFTNTYNNVDFSVGDSDDARFRLLIYREDFTTPAWFHGSTMYQIFTDRFYRGKGETEYAEGATINEDWYDGVPQYGAYPGAPVANDMFFGGNLWDIAEKLDRLTELGVDVIYLNPIFEARSNHKYDIGDYLKVDDGFGGEAAFDALVKKAKKLGIKIILDGVFNHTGDDSRYFDRYGRYGSGRKYYDWYCRNAAGDPECWWGVTIMPRLDQTKEKCRRFFTGEDGVARKYIKSGIAGWRLDVADELCDDFLDEFRASVKDESGGKAVIIGEVWENAADKVAYGKRRRYLRGRQLDSVMNYPLRNGLIAFARFGDAQGLYNVLTEIYSSYPKCVSDSLMNIVGTHDTERILTVLGGDEDFGYSNDELATKKMTDEQRSRAKRLLKMISTLQYTVYGVPSLYYGDETGLEGYHDPFCRRTYPWGREDAELLSHYKKLGEIRKDHKAFSGGAFKITHRGNDFIAFERKNGKDRVFVAANAGDQKEIALIGSWRDELSGKVYENKILVDRDAAIILTEM